MDYAIMSLRLCNQVAWTMIQDNQVVVMEKRVGISKIMINNHKIAHDEKTAE